jgi:hypothetical protein
MSKNLLIIIGIACAVISATITLTPSSVYGTTDKEQPASQDSKLPKFGKYDESKISAKILEAVKIVEKTGTVMGDKVGYAGSDPPQAYITLKKDSTKEELKELTRHPSAAVRCSAIQGLAKREDIDFFPIIMEHTDDTVTVMTVYYDMLSEENVGDFFINEFNAKLTHEQWEKLANTLLFAPNNLNTTYSILQTIEPNEKYYSRIRELALEDKYPMAVVGLARFKKEQDLKLILDNQKKSPFYTYRAISYFPNPYFMDFLKDQLVEILPKNHYYTEWREYYKAVAAYQNKEALDILRTPLLPPSGPVFNVPMRQYHINYVFEAVSNYKIDLYDPLLFKLWNDYDNKIDLKTLDYLWSKDPVKCLKAIPKSLGAAYLLTDHIDVVEKMLDILAEKDKSAALEIINKNILSVNVHVFPVFSKKASFIKDESSIEPLFARMEKEDNPHIYIEAVRAILTYERKELNQRLMQIVEKRGLLKEGWSVQELEKILRSKGVSEEDIKKAKEGK